MFTNLWKKCVERISPRRRQAPRPTSAVLRLEVLENRITPTNFNTSILNGTLTIAKAGSASGSLTVTSSGVFGEYTFTTTGGNTINNGGTVFTNIVPVNAITVNLGAGDDQLVFDGTGANGPVNISNGLTINGSSGDKIITLKTVNLLSHYTNSHSNDALDIDLTGNGTETTTFTDVNVTGVAVISHRGVGNTAVTFNTTGLNPTLTNYWDNLTINNGTGSDINKVLDTDFAGNVLINNGDGASGDTNQYGGSETTFNAGNNPGLLNALGNITVTTNTGQSYTEVDDYNVEGTVAVTTGAGVNNQSTGNYVAIQANPKNSAPVPTIGAVNITGSAVKNLSPGLQVYIGANFFYLLGANFPVFIAGGLNISAGGSGAVNILLNDTAVGGATTLSLGSKTYSDNVTIQGNDTAIQADATSSYHATTITSSAIGTNTFDVQTIEGVSNFLGALTFKLANATNTIDMGTGDTGIVNTSGNFAVTGASGSTTINVNDSVLGGISMNFTGTNAEDTTFTDTNVVGAAAITHSGGNTTFDISSSALNNNNFNSWNSLTINNGAGSDTNTITDTSFSGNVTINNGAGASGNRAQYGGSHTVLSDNLNPGLLTIHGNLVISTSSGQSDTEVYDYNIHGTVTISTGNGIGNQSIASYIGLEDNQTHAGSGTPVIDGDVTITGTSVNGVNPGVVIDLGTSLAGNQNFPLVINGKLNITANGPGSATIDMNDLIVAYNTTTVTLAATTDNDTLDVQGTSINSVYWDFVLNSNAGGANGYNFQDSAGTLQMIGTLQATFGGGADTVNLGADSGSPNGTTGAIVELFSTSEFSGGGGTNTLFAAPGATLFDYFAPVLKNI